MEELAAEVEILDAKEDEDDGERVEMRQREHDAWVRERFGERPVEDL